MFLLLNCINHKITGTPFFFANNAQEQQIHSKNVRYEQRAVGTGNIIHKRSIYWAQYQNHHVFL